MNSEIWELGSSAGESGTAGRGIVGMAAPITPQEYRLGEFFARVIVIEGEPWFVALDVAAALGYSAASALTRTLDEDEKGVHSLHTPGGAQESTIISEAGLFSAILRSRIPAARAFKRWVTHDVLPSIRRTGSYAVPETPEQLMSRALVTAQGIIARKDEQIAALMPSAEAWDELADAGTDYAVGDAAKILQRAGVATSPQRLFEQLREAKWIFRGGDRRWRAYSGAVQTGYLAERAMPPRRDPDTCGLIAVAPQVRVTARGLERLRQRLGAIVLTP
ncbi:BRO family protein [Microbacterium saperdae]